MREFHGDRARKTGRGTEHRSPGRAASALLALGLLVAFAGPSGCGGGDSEVEKLMAASEELARAREELERAEEEVRGAEAAFEEAQAALDAARARASEARQAVADAEAQVDQQATDDVIFRAVQLRLLEDRKLRDRAVRAEVEGGVVTLTGRVRTREEAERAMEVARQTPGVRDVVSRLEVFEGTPAP